jgi:protein-L-isoaspartate(D-aspartate) O-methyltransferase
MLSCPAPWAAVLDSLLTQRVIVDPRVRAAMSKVDRANYCQSASGCYMDAPQRIGWGITISAPHMHARALEELSSKLQPGSRALDVGSGSGYLTTAMAQMVGPSGLVVGIDHIPELVEWSRANVRRDHKQSLVDQGTMELHVRDGFGGFAEKGPYDAIHVGAAPERIPEALKQQLKPGGVLLLPVGPNGGEQKFVRVTRDPDPSRSDRFEELALFGVRYVPLTTAAKQLGERF